MESVASADEVALDFAFRVTFAKANLRLRCLELVNAHVFYVKANVASGLQSLSAAHVAAAEPPDEDALVCGDPRAKQPALELADGLVGGRAIDAGPLENSRALESMTAVILNVNREYGITAGLRLTGFP